MKKMKKFLAMMLAMAMVLGMSVTTFAVPGNEGITVSGVEAEDGVTVTVKAYQIVKYNELGYYEEVLKNTIPTEGGKLVLEGVEAAAAVAELATRKNELPSITLEKGSDGAYHSNTKTENTATAGTWMILVEGSQNYLYNPAIVSVQQDPNGLDYGTLNLATATWGSDVYLKRSAPTIEKSVENESDNESVQYGNVLTFTVASDIPYYTDEVSATGFVYTISDTLTGLDLVVDDSHPVTVALKEKDKISDVTGVDGLTKDLATLNEAAVNVIKNGEKSFSVDLSSQLDLLKKYPDKKIVLTYSARVTSEAELVIDEVSNNATLKYSANGVTQEKSSTTEHYTFGISAKLDASVEETLKQFVKTDANGTVELDENGKVVVTDGIALGGAVFQVREGSATGTVFEGPGSTVANPAIADVTGKVYTTKADGSLEVTGLDADKIYYLVEVKAPTGYTLNSTPIKVQAIKTTDATGFTGYTVKIGDQENGTTFTFNKETKVSAISGVLNPFGFKNSSLTELPSTGGIGTTIFTIGGCAIMIIAAGLYFSLRRKSAR